MYQKLSGEGPTDLEVFEHLTDKRFTLLDGSQRDILVNQERMAREIENLTLNGSRPAADMRRQVDSIQAALLDHINTQTNEARSIAVLQEQMSTLVAIAKWTLTVFGSAMLGMLGMIIRNGFIKIQIARKLVASA